MHDLRYACRTLRKQPVFTVVAVLTLALAIGANTAIFSLLYQMLLRPLPYREPGRLVAVHNAYLKAGHELSRVAIPDYLDRRAEAPAIEDAALVASRDVSLVVSGAPEQIAALDVTPSFFSTLGRGPMLGRAFTDADAVPGQDDVAILTHALWRSHFGGDRAIVGRTIRLDGRDRVVVGVMAPDFDVPWPDWRMAGIFVPFSFTPAQRSDLERGTEFARMIARLRPGGTIAQLDAQMQTIVTRLMDRVPQRASYMRNSGFTGLASPLAEQTVGDARVSLYLLQSAVIVILLIACANVANLLLMRATGRQRELALRWMLGAREWRIARQLLTEGAVLSALGTAAGLVLGAVSLRMLLALVSDQLPASAGTAIRPAVVLFAIVLAAGSTLIFGLVPAISIARGRTAAMVNDDSSRGSASKRTRRLRAVLVVIETAAAVVLLVSAGLLLKSFLRVARVDPGFTVDRVLTAQIALAPGRYQTPAQSRAFWTRLLEKARGIPGVTAAGLISEVPFSGRFNAGSYTIVGRQLAPTERLPHARQSLVAGDYFRAMQIPLLEGRLFDDNDTADSPRVAIVDQLFVRRQFPGESALGHQINFGSARNYTIVGVVGTINSADLARPVPEERTYLNATQVSPSSMGLVLKAGLEPTVLVPQIRAAVQSLDPEQPIADTNTMEEWLSRSLGTRRAPMTLISLFGLVALVLSAIGIYGVLTFGVAQRTREFGIRQALGAERRSILLLVLTQGLATTSVGIVLGLAASVAATRLLQSMLFGVATYDPAVFATVTATLVTVAIAACYVPARRATRVDPMVALRQN